MTSQPSSDGENLTPSTPAENPSDKKPASAKAPSSAPNPNAHVSVMQDPDDPDMVIIRTRKRVRKKGHSKKKRMNPTLRIVLIVLAVIVGIAAAAGIALAIAVHMGNVNLHQVFGGTQNMPASAQTKDDGQVVEYKGHTYRYNDNVVSILFIGHDDESTFATRPDASCADANALFTIDTATNKARMTVIPRNSWVPVDVYDQNSQYIATRSMQLTLSHAVWLPTNAECAANTTKSVSRVFYDLPVKYYFDIDQDVVREASTAVGGVQVQALESIPGENFAAGDTVLLEGQSALRYVKYRNVDEYESALARQARQVQFVKSFVAKASALGAQGLLNLYNSVSKDVTTNLGVPELSYLISCFVTGGNANLEVSSLTGTTELFIDSDGIEYERYILNDESVMENTLAAFYTQID